MSCTKEDDGKCRHCCGSGWVVRDPDIGTDQECFVCDGTGMADDSKTNANPEPDFWVRYTSDGEGWEGPIHNSRIEEVRKASGAWTPLYASANRDDLITALYGMQRFFGKWPELVPSEMACADASEAVDRMNSAIATAKHWKR